MANPTPSAATQEFFNPEQVFGSDTAFSKWEVQTDNPNTTVQRAQALKSGGDELDHKEYDAKTSESVTFTAKDDTAEIPPVGKVVNGWHIDTVVITWGNTVFCQMTITCHKHGTSAHDATRYYTATLQNIGCKFGCPATITGLIIPTGAGVRSVTLSLGVNHVDEPDRQGDHLAAGNYDGSETVECELCDSGVIYADEDNGWTLMSLNHQRTNTAAEATSGSAEHHIQGTLPAEA